MGIFIKELVDHARVAGLTMDINDFKNDKRHYVAEQLASPFERATRRLEYIEVGFVIRHHNEDDLDAALDAFEDWIDSLHGATDLSSTYRIDDFREEKLLEYKADAEFGYYLCSYKFHCTNKSKI